MNVREVPGLVFGADPDAPPLRVLWGLLAGAVAGALAGWLLSEDDEPADLGD